MASARRQPRVHQQTPKPGHDQGLPRRTVFTMDFATGALNGSSIVNAQNPKSNGIID